MFDIAPTKIFKDSIHGYIRVPKCFAEHIINTESFQRLRNIDQTGMRILYPDAKHDRFGHSLGVFHLGSKAVDALLANFSSNPYWRITSDNTRLLFWAKNKLLFLIACLLHDIGHAPFSHSLEYSVYANSAKNKKKFDEFFLEKINDMENMTDESLQPGYPIGAAPHEILGAMMVLDQWKENIAAIYRELQVSDYPKDEGDQFLYAEHYERGGQLDDSTLDQDLCFIARMICGLKYKGFEPEKQIRNCFIELLNGQNFDVDKLDYIIRDTRMSGISNIDIDVERLLNAVSLVIKTKYVNQVFPGEDFSGRTARSIKNYVLPKCDVPEEDITLDKYVHIQGNFKGIFHFEQDTLVCIKGGSQIGALLNEKDGVEIVFWDSESASFECSADIWKNNEKIVKVTRKNRLSLPAQSNNAPFRVRVQHAVLAPDSQFSFQAKSKGHLEINGKCDIYIRGKWNTSSSVSFFDNTRISGSINELEVMGDTLFDRIPDNSAYTLFSVGFHKQALNIIANVLEARNYLYLWVYAHHKVIYYANFLIPVLAYELLIAPKGGTEDIGTIFPWHLEYKDIPCLDDAYIWTIIRYYYKMTPKPQGGETEEDQYCLTVLGLCREILTHNYKRSIWKSLAEFQFLFEAFSEEEVEIICGFFLDKIANDRPCVMDRDGAITAGYLKTELLDEICGYANLQDYVESIVCVSAEDKSKAMNPSENYIFMQGEAIPLDKIYMFSQKKENGTAMKKGYFYLYYELKESVSNESDDIAARIREGVKKTADRVVRLTAGTSGEDYRL